MWNRFKELGQVQRLFLGVATAYYIVVAGLYFSHYLPVERAMGWIEKTVSDDGPSLPFHDPDAMLEIANLSYHEAKLETYGSMLLWGTVVIVVLGVAIFAGSRRSAVEK